MDKCKNNFILLTLFVIIIAIIYTTIQYYWQPPLSSNLFKLPMELRRILPDKAKLSYLSGCLSVNHKNSSHE